MRPGVKPRNPCLHQHYSGRFCRQPAPPDRGYCGIHKQGVCSECEDMQKMFPVRKTVIDYGKL